MAKPYLIDWAPVAIRDLEEIFDYVALHNSFDRANHLHSKILNRVKTLSSHPTRCRIVPELKEVGVNDYRELIIAPYRVFFRITGRTVGIVGVLDGRRDLEELLISRILRESS
ncbi:type II toxin-antitoxin system RelE/ParE family toxin [Acidobacteria bacterium AH-259-G07]|nr:type II toxin-antitoxin system RelE/ParE family toxin [Acidobacteria bacterium AH-259-G07]